MCFIENHGIGNRQQFADTTFLQCQIGKKQMVINHHHIGLLRFAARLHHKTFLMEFALRAKAVIAGRCDQIPDRGIFRYPRQLRLVAALGSFDETRDFAQIADILTRCQTAIGLHPAQMIVTDIIRPSLEQRNRHRCTQGLAHGWNVTQKQLILQRLGSGGYDHLATPQQRRYQIGIGFTGAGTGLSQQGALAGNRLRNRLGHFGLRSTRRILAERSRQRAFGGKKLFDFGVVQAFRHGGKIENHVFARMGGGGRIGSSQG